MPFHFDKLIAEDPRVRLMWKIEHARGGKYVTSDPEGKKEIKTLRNNMRGWMQLLDKPPVRIRLHFGYGWFTDEEWHQTPEKCFAKAEMYNLVIATGKHDKIYTSRAGMKEARLHEKIAEGTIGWQQTTPDCRMQVCYRTIQLNDGKYITDWESAHHFFSDGQQ